MVLLFYEERLMQRHVYRKILVSLSLTMQGLTDQEILAIVDSSHKSKADKNEWEMTLFIFKSFFYKIKDLWRVSNSVFQAAVNKLFCSDEETLK